MILPSIVEFFDFYPLYLMGGLGAVVFLVRDIDRFHCKGAAVSFLGQVPNFFLEIFLGSRSPAYIPIFPFFPSVIPRGSRS